MDVDEIRPVISLSLPSSSDPEWEQVNQLFKRHGLAYPPWRLRDELVGWLVWARYAEKLAKEKAPA